MLRWTFCVIRCYSFCILSFILTTAGQRASTLYVVAIRLPLSPSVFSFFIPPFPSVGVAKVTLYFQSPNFGATFFSFLPACWNPRRCSHSRPICARRYSLKAGAKVCVYPIQSKYMPKFFFIKLRTVATVALFSAQWGVKKNSGIA